jgi:5-methylcytosine-specific restriction protein A
MSPIVKQCIGTPTERCTEHIALGQARCARHARAEARRRATRKAAKPQAKYYNTARWRNETRPAVLERDPVCTVCGEQTSTIADHWPVPLTALVDQGHDPYDADHCRGVCHRCSGRHDGGRSQERAWIG